GPLASGSQAALADGVRAQGFRRTPERSVRRYVSTGAQPRHREKPGSAGVAPAQFLAVVLGALDTLELQLGARIARDAAHLMKALVVFDHYDVSKATQGSLEPLGVAGDACNHATATEVLLRNARHHGRVGVHHGLTVLVVVIVGQSVLGEVG